MIVGVDIETCSAASLKNQGAAHYAEHPTTRVHCVAFAGLLPSQRFIWQNGDYLPDWVREGLLTGGAVAHSAAFESSIFKSILVPRFGFPMPKRWIDTMLIAAAFNLPQNLGMLGKSLGTPVSKDMEGRALMLKLAKVKHSKKTGFVFPIPTPEEMAKLCAYCMDDVLTMLGCLARMPKLPAAEHEMIEIDRRINERGVLIDQPLAQAIQTMTVKREHEIARTVFGETLDMIGVKSPQVLIRWLDDQGIVAPTAVRKTDEGFKATPSIDRAAIAKILANPAASEIVRDVLAARIETGRTTSLAKTAKVPRVVCADGRGRWLLRYCKAHTGRWASEFLQLHNLTRPTKAFTQIRETFLRAVRAGNFELVSMLHPVLEGLSYALRSLVIARPGYDLIGGDLAGIEARVMALVAGYEEKLNVFRRYDAATTKAERAALDPYIIAAAKIGTDNRDLGKVCELSLQYGSGAITFCGSALKFGITLTLKQARQTQLAWRKANAPIVDFWHAIQDAVAEAMVHTGQPFFVGDYITVVGSKDCLRIILPSGRALHYWRPHQLDVMREIKTVDDEGNIVIKRVQMRELRFVRPHKRGMKVESTYGGKLTENIVQAIARDVLRDDLRRLDNTDPYDQIVLHVHDSIAVEVPHGIGSVEEFCEVMAVVPDWAPELPIAVDGYRSGHFKG